MVEVKIDGVHWVEIVQVMKSGWLVHYYPVGSNQTLSAVVTQGGELRHWDDDEDTLDKPCPHYFASGFYGVGSKKFADKPTSDFERNQNVDLALMLSAGMSAAILHDGLVICHKVSRRSVTMSLGWCPQHVKMSADGLTVICCRSDVVVIFDNPLIG